MKFCVFSLVLLLGLFFFRIVSGDYIPIVGMVVATISGELVFQIMGWLVWQMGFMHLTVAGAYVDFIYTG